jgi:hypothetical protein
LRIVTERSIVTLFFLLVTIVLSCLTISAQQPFVTDDADVTPKRKFHFEFSGNETTGVLGIKSRGTVFTGGGSVVREIGPKLELGVELVGAITRSFNLGKSQLQTMVGGNYSFRDNMTFDFGIVAGKHAASPRVGIQLGISMDW